MTLVQDLWRALLMGWFLLFVTVIKTYTKKTTPMICFKNSYFYVNEKVNKTLKSTTVQKRLVRLNKNYQTNCIQPSG